MTNSALVSRFTDAVLLDGIRTPFADLNGPLSQVSPIDLGIKAARAVIAAYAIGDAAPAAPALVERVT